MNAVKVVALNTVREILRDRILYGLLLFAILLVFLSLLMGGLSFAQQERIITDLGLVAVEFGCCMLAIFVGSSLVFREIEKQTILLLISKPMTRSQFLLGKFAGLTTVLILVDLLVSAFLALVCKQFGEVHWPQFIVSQAGVLLESMVLLSVVIFFGTFAKPVLTTIYSMGIWLVGHSINDLQYFSQKSSSVFMKNFGSVFSRIFPNLALFNFREAALYGDPIPHVMILKAVVLWAAWFVILLISSIWVFNRRDFV